MNMNIDIENRALLDTGQSPLSEEDIAEKSKPYELCKSYYITTFLEALSEVEWVGGRKRAALVRTGRPVVRDGRYRFAYDMPCDCARPIELQGNDYFIAEDRLILTDAPDAELLYVSNGRVLRPTAVASGVKPGELSESEYFTAGPPGTEPTIRSIREALRTLRADCPKTRNRTVITPIMQPWSMRLSSLNTSRKSSRRSSL
jgi:hypothetical protein